MGRHPTGADGDHRIDLTGPIDRTSMHDLLNCIADLRLRRPHTVHADLGGITAVDETDAAAILFTLLNLRRDGVDVSIAGVRHPVLRQVASEVLAPGELALDAS